MKKRHYDETPAEPRCLWENPRLAPATLISRQQIIAEAFREAPSESDLKPEGSFRVRVSAESMREPLA